VREDRERHAWATQSQEIAGLREELAREHERLLALQDIGAASGSILNIDELLSLVVTRITRVMECDRTTIYLLDEEGKDLVARVAEGEQRHEIRLPVGAGLAGWVARSGQLQNIADVYDDHRFDPAWDQRTGYRTRSMLCVPMKNRLGRPLGVIQCLNKRHGAFTIEDEAMLSALAAQAAVTIENGRFFVQTIQKNMELLETKQQLERRVQELDVLVEIAHVSASARSLDQLLEGVLGRAVRAIDAEAGSILLAEDGGHLRFRCAIGGAPQAIARVQIPVGTGICGWVAQNRQPKVVNDVSADTRHRADVAASVGYRPRSVLAVPLSWTEPDGTDGIGALELLNKHAGRGPFTEDDVRLATLIASNVSSAISLARARERTEREERLATIGQLLSGVLHDLKTPMAVIAGYTRELTLTEEPPLRERFAQTILKQVDLINAMTRETIAFARGDRSVWLRKVYLKQFFEEVLDQLRRELEPKGVEIELVLEDKGVARLDQHKIQRAVHNLARNAAEAIGPPQGRRRGGKVTLRVARRAGTADGLPEAIVIECIDDGPGIPEEIRERVFESFITHGKASGTGLGLAVVKKVADDHGGAVEVESVPGRTVFRLVLPQIEASAAELEKEG
jgi:signal transduction histidine kinase/putative methionine-R-sulfoxide reductase with GAF domain